ncbi:MAG: YqgE/AlgH family protein [bacterium]
MTQSLQLLIAMPALNGSYFERSVILLCEHNTKGAMGLVINKITELSLADILDQIGIRQTQNEDARLRPVFTGGPVHEDRGFVLHRPWGTWESSLTISDELQLTSSKDILKEIAKGRGPDDFLISLGYSGWAEGQLEEELVDTSWLTLPADQELIFDADIEDRWDLAVEKLGVDINQISTLSGHA